MDHPSDRHALTRRSLVGAGLGGVAAAAATSAAFAQGTPPANAPAQPGALTTAPVSQAGLGPRLTMHAIDQFHGTPGAGMICDLSMHDGSGYKPIKTVTTAPNGRTAEPILVDDAVKVGRYELLMHFEEYFAKIGVKLPSPNFLGLVPIRFQIRDAGQRYHLPVLFTPWGYSYYRGS
ncbi:hydroxyisourate hydrolase [Methylobacterium sp. NEAU 140]|uniref:hydroxyisourate hydrolase n=1 Tax=Methylobacterium sp. NEAU 140 TaxID=3064945 RepID=UPI0027364C42|nr:hydroxyisourate hydrolase [Methylobacterium sp. NEAU 140]MDP4021721.1 hydroxyisourate hydrolase [Methylobacterium sp. NEAU 140]